MSCQSRTNNPWAVHHQGGSILVADELTFFGGMVPYGTPESTKVSKKNILKNLIVSKEIQSHSIQSVDTRDPDLKVLRSFRSSEKIGMKPSLEMLTEIYVFFVGTLDVSEIYHQVSY